MQRLGLAIFAFFLLAGVVAAAGGVSNPACLLGMGAGLALAWLGSLPTTPKSSTDSQRGAHR